MPSQQLPNMAQTGVAALEAAHSDVDVKVQVIGLHKYVVDPAFASHFPTKSLFAYDATLCDSEATVSAAQCCWCLCPLAAQPDVHCSDSRSPAPIFQ